ncbi:MAG: Holliday junction DNA helicase RuvA [Candidatus Doudnabacteria bacterium RIFCSPHIGHO2_01_FULL_46_14]|uniref:Holliday junction branch migration complex subunit RuvA n=1 Tax=Candidatus Doudnabacteria bacterium RIFCSPHIGHO2_01_FULL_46_14 TaxID=1817824 RepID=A0A1F5NK20_9BACT|nr:MAG: Holliday junction DNA helicase RuvA [Candidatus Doudnabacteria bacterium RIFCSPHIGHO2_01_FULL_46_14]
MISFLDGTIKAIRKNYLIVMTDYVGYKVFVTPQILLNVQPAQKTSLFTFTYVREDQLALYGFSTLNELEFFEQLIGVSGIGPKSALAIMSVGTLDVIKSGILNGDVSLFTQVSGVGRKTAERLILELKEKIASSPEELAAPRHSDVIDVLMALGYSRTEAREALAQVPADLKDSEDKIRFALRSLAKQ